jgi:GNAT superfamily N-acetyltransferase
MIQIPLATIADAAAILELTREIQQLHRDALPVAFKPPSDQLFPPEKVRQILKDPDSILAVADVEGGVVGHVYAVIRRRIEDAFKPSEDSVYVQQIAVNQGARRRGFGKQLLSFVTEHARTRGISILHVDCFAFNGTAQNFFGECGFVPLRMTFEKRL